MSSQKLRLLGLAEDEEAFSDPSAMSASWAASQRDEAPSRSCRNQSIDPHQEPRVRGYPSSIDLASRALRYLSALLALLAVQDGCPGCSVRDALPAHGESEPVPVEDHVVAEHLSQPAIQCSVLDGVGECLAGAAEGGGPLGDRLQRPPERSRARAKARRRFTGALSMREQRAAASARGRGGTTACSP